MSSAHRRREIHFNVTAHPTSEWAAQQIAEAFPGDTTPRYLSLEKDAPETRPVQPLERGSVVELAEVGGLHHRYARRPA